MAEFITDKQLDDKLTDIIWNAKKELIILSPYIILDEYCKKIFKQLKNNPELKIVIIFGKNERETRKSLNPENLELFKEFSHVTIIYCHNLHAKYFSNESEALLTSLNLLGKSMTGNIEYGICFQKEESKSEKLYEDSFNYTKELLSKNPCIYVKRPVFIETSKDKTKRYIESKVIYDVTELLYNNAFFEKKYHNEFETELLEAADKPTRENYTHDRKYVGVLNSTKTNLTDNTIVIEAEDDKIIKVNKTIFPLIDKDLIRIHQYFQERYSGVKINSTNTYVFCKKLLPYADVMFREGLEIRFNFQSKNLNQIIKVLENIKFEANHYKYKREMDSNNNGPYSYVFIPQEVTDIQKLIFDYIFMTNTILEKTKSIN
ncbi:phospholipase D family protein [Flavobacterium sp. Arc2]|uniref:phospholipase D family protein n=1 Tax=Flavobacterium sp. Arc2 TaxID=3046685 RepID=UPI00352CFE86